jgi:hypothetical protein
VREYDCSARIRAWIAHKGATVTTGWAFVVCDSLEKVFPDTPPRPINPAIPLSVTLGETASIQLAYRPPLDPGFRDPRPATLTVSGPAARHVEAHSVELVPCEIPAFPGHDPGYLRDTPGLYPDLLAPLVDGRLDPLIGSWRSAWIDLRVDDASDAGSQLVDLLVSSPDGDELFRTRWEVEVLPLRLPPGDVVVSQWVHADAVADHYGWPVFGEEHWAALELFLGSAAEMGANSVLTPVWTPPLDTAIGSYRTPVQLVDVEDLGDGSYRFGFDRLERWLRICRAHGITGIEIAHLFTQWGARCAPAVYATRGGAVVRLFGWETPATDIGYRRFLEQLLPALCAWLDDRWDPAHVAFHISDEPEGEAGLASYLAAKAVVADLLAGRRVIDAVSDPAFLRTGAVPVPVVATDAIEPVLEARPAELWAYYCVTQDREVANRLLALPSSRNRVIGHQLYIHRIDGFLHWGFNFYYSWQARRRIDPYRDTSGGGGLIGGDPFVVYPGPEGRPLPSIRYRVFAQAMADLRAMQAARERHGDAAVRDIVDPGGTLTFRRYETDADHYLTVRERLNELLR